MHTHTHARAPIHAHPQRVLQQEHVNTIHALRGALHKLGMTVDGNRVHVSKTNFPPKPPTVTIHT